MPRPIPKARGALLSRSAASLTSSGVRPCSRSCWRTWRGVSPSSILRIGLQSGQSPPTHITGYACACPQPDAPTRPAVVLDPFAGTGTTMLVASVLGRIGVGVDRSMDYARLARWRTRDPGERARALGVPKPPPVPDGQGSLFDDLSA